MGRSLTATRRARRTSADSRSSMCPRARRRLSGLPRSPSPAAVLKRFASSCPTQRWATDRSPNGQFHAHGSRTEQSPGRVFQNDPRGSRGRLRRWFDDFGDDPAVLADLAVADESQLLVGRQGAVEEEAGGNRTCVLGIALYVAAAETCDQFERPGERRRGDALAPVPLADEVAGDPPVRQGRYALLVGSPVLDLRHLVRRAELAPTHTVVAIEHKGRVCPACPHPCELAFPVQRRLAAVIRMKAHAPTTPEDAVIRLNQPGERIPARLIESLHREPRPHHQLSLTRQHSEHWAARASSRLSLASTRVWDLLARSCSWCAA